METAQRLQAEPVIYHRVFIGGNNRGKRSVTADTALRLARYFETSPEFWLGLQTQYDLDCEKDELGSWLEREVQVYSKVH